MTKALKVPGYSPSFQRSHSSHRHLGQIVTAPTAKKQRTKNACLLVLSSLSVLLYRSQSLFQGMVPPNAELLPLGNGKQLKKKSSVSPDFVWNSPIIAQNRKTHNLVAQRQIGVQERWLEIQIDLHWKNPPTLISVINIILHTHTITSQYLLEPPFPGDSSLCQINN